MMTEIEREEKDSLSIVEYDKPEEIIVLFLRFFVFMTYVSTIYA